MASRNTVRQSRANPQRSSASNIGENKDARGKRRPDGTPDKAKSIVPDEGAQDDADLSRRVIMNDEILALQIKEENLQKLREPMPPCERKHTPVFNTVYVRVPKQATFEESPPGKSVAVAHPAPRDSPVKFPDLTKLAGARFDDAGKVIPHSILGDVNEFLTQAAQSGDISEQEAVQTSRSSGSLTPINGKKGGRQNYPQFQSVDESNALKNWRTNIADRKRQQNYLSRLLNKPIDHLVMNQSDKYRKIQELRDLVDRTLPFVENGKGHAKGAEFWNLPMNLGDDLNGIHSTLTETEKGYAPAVHHIGVPRSVVREKGLDVQTTPAASHKPWLESQYLCNRVLQLAPLMDELDPHEPEMEDLEIVGNSKPSVTGNAVGMEQDGSGDNCKTPAATDSNDAELEIRYALKDHPGVHHSAVFGPSVRFGGFRAQWTGDSHSHQNDVAVDARVSFEAHECERTMSCLEIGNDGTTAIYYSWKKVPMANPFSVVSARIQRFYFNQSNGVVLPGDVLQFPFVFKSPNAGVFSEQWEFHTHPVVAGGAKLVVTLRGIALKQDKFLCHRAELERDLEEKQCHQIVDSLIDELVAGVKTPERPSSPVDSYLTEEEQFRRTNPLLKYNYDKFEQLSQLYQLALPEDERGRPWDLDVCTIRQAISRLPDEDDTKQDMLQELNSIVASLSFRTFAPVNVSAYNAGYSIMSGAIDGISQQDIILRLLVGLPDKTTKSSMSPAQIAAPTAPTSDTKLKSQKSVKDKKSNKEARLSPTKKDPAAPKAAKSQSSVSSLATDNSTSGTSVGNVSTTSSTTTAATDDAAIQTKYRNKLYTQTYLQLCDMVDTMDSVLGDLQQRACEQSYVR